MSQEVPGAVWDLTQAASRTKAGGDEAVLL